MRTASLALVLSVSLLHAERNLDVNGSFEFAAEGLPPGWAWSPGKGRQECLPYSRRAPRSSFPWRPACVRS